MIYYKILDDSNEICAKGSTCDGVDLPNDYIEITKQEFDDITFVDPDAVPPPAEDPPLAVDQQLILTQLQQQEVLDALLLAQLGGNGNV